jgi:hypothetical protein
MGIVFQSEQARAWVDEENIGHIRVIRRINFSSLMSVISQVAIAEGDFFSGERIVRIYIPTSLKAIDSDNLRSLITFAEVCGNIQISIIENDIS